MDLEIRPGLVIPAAELDVRFTPSGGPGGQHANRSNTRVELTWNIAESPTLDDATRRRLVTKLGAVVRVVVDDERSQYRNRSAAIERLETRVKAALVRPKSRRPTKPSRNAKRRRVDSKKRRGELKNTRRRPNADD